MHTRFVTIAASLVAAAVIALNAEARAEFVITFSQSGPDVVASGAGTLNFYDLSFVDFDSSSNFVEASAGAVLLGPVPVTYTDIFTGTISGPTTFGPGGNFLATFGSSTAPNESGVGINGAAQILYIPGGYAADTPITANLTWADTTIGGLGLTPGTYVWTWGDANPDRLTVIIPVAAVPEPSSVVTLGLGAIGLVGVTLRRRRV